MCIYIKNGNQVKIKCLLINNNYNNFQIFRLLQYLQCYEIRFIQTQKKN